MCAATQHHVETAVRGTGGRKITPRPVYIPGLVQNIVGDDRVEVSPDQFAQRRLIDLSMLDAQVSQAAAGRRRFRRPDTPGRVVKSHDFGIFEAGG
jgi:hypothetical protein